MINLLQDMLNLQSQVRKLCIKQLSFLVVQHPNTLSISANLGREEGRIWLLSLEDGEEQISSLRTPWTCLWTLDQG